MKTNMPTVAVAVTALFWLMTPWQALAAQPSSADERPNLIVVVADDLGFSDLGSFGGEIRTPNVDQLATEGMRFTNFYVSATCSPTRSMLMTGVDNHVAGLGNMYEKTAPNQLGVPGYEGVLRTDYPTIAEVLREHGYRTYMAGKWHLGHQPDRIPHARGFERSFSILNGAGSHFDMTGGNRDNEESEFVEDNRYLERLPKGYYSSTTFTDRLIDYIDSNRGGDEPFFAYLAFQAPHDPLQVPKGWLRRYLGDYDIGWDAIRERRLKKMKALGIMPLETENSPRVWYFPEWDRLTGIAQVQNARRMEIYAAMVEFMDHEIGRLVQYLEATGQLENTWIVFFSDNGPNPHDPISQAKRGAGAFLDSNFFATNYRTAFESWGRADGFVSQGGPWAQVSATPFSGFKLSSFEGGIRSPLVVWGPSHARAGDIDTQSIVHVADLAPTLLDLAGIDTAKLIPERGQPYQTGVSQRRLLQGFDVPRVTGRTAFGMELFGGRAFRQGNWKITWMHEPYGIDDWQLFDLTADPAELNDLSQAHPDIKADLVDAFHAYAAANNVTIPDRTVYDGVEDKLPPRPSVDAPQWPRGQEKNWTNAEEADDE
ncbi:MAG: arylsulfatase [Xanthomonadales bacterium]|nr:arylsulfatase [Xanthomonadales bacterium]